jgi:acetyl-CoA carboxylase biotin carboxyl carrier protein
MTDQHRAEEVATLREQVSELVQQIDGPLRKVSASAGDTEVTVEWAEPDAVHPNGDAAEQPVERPETETDSAADRIRVTAPLVGTFYRAPEPGADPFVEVGSTVEAGQTVGIVEAMKLMNPVKAAKPGTVTAIHAENGQMVEFDQLLVELTEE